MTADDVRARAIEAGAKALGRDENFGLPRTVDWARSAAVIDAVEPIIREQIAQEIEEKADDFGFEEILDAFNDPAELREVVKDALHDAARIARGDAL